MTPSEDLLPTCFPIQPYYSNSYDTRLQAYQLGINISERAPCKCPQAPCACLSALEHAAGPWAA